MKDLCLVKIGGSVITDTHRANTPRIAEMRRLAKELRAASAKKSIIIGHGSGSFGHVVAHRYRTNEGLVNSQSMKGAALTRHIAAQLSQIFIEQLLRSGINAFHFAPSAGAVAANGRIVGWNIEPIREALKRGFMPVINGDVVIDTKKGFCIASTEEGLRYLATKLKPSMVIVSSDTDGVFTADPNTDKNAELIRLVTRKNINKIRGYVGGSRKVDVTGGMRTKLDYVYEIAKETGATCMIINAKVPGRLRNAILGKRIIGTVVKY
jgi:isopentenyl phosphate kinase